MPWNYRSDTRRNAFVANVTLWCHLLILKCDILVPSITPIRLQSCWVLLCYCKSQLARSRYQEPQQHIISCLHL